MKLVDVKKAIEKKVDENTLQSGDALVDVSAVRFRTGVTVFDIILGGGLPLAKFNEFWGDQKSGKTTMALRIAGQFLKTFTNQSVVWCDMEAAYDNTWARNFIEDPRRFHLIRPDYGEQAVDLFCELMESEDAGFGVFDSLGGLFSQHEAEGEASDRFVAHQTFLVNRFVKKMAPILNQSSKRGKPKGVIVVNQARTKFGGVSFGPTTKPTGGKYLGHVLTTSTHFYLREVKKVGSLPTFSMHTFTLDKNRLGLSRRSGEFAFYMRAFEGHRAGELEESKTLLAIGRDTEVFQKKGSEWVVAGKKFSTLNDLQAAIIKDEKFRESIKNAILEHCINNAVAVGEDAKDE